MEPGSGDILKTMASPSSTPAIAWSSSCANMLSSSNSLKASLLGVVASLASESWEAASLAAFASAFSGALALAAAFAFFFYYFLGALDLTASFFY